MKTEKGDSQRKSVVDFFIKWVLPVVGLGLYCGGLYSFTQYTSKAHWTYISENALLPGSGWSLWENADSQNMVTYTQQFRKGVPAGQTDQQAQWLAKKMEAIGLETYVYHSSASSNNSVATWGILRAPKGDGKECILLSANWNSEHSGALPGEDTASDSVGMVLAVAQYLTRQSWLAKDYVFVLASSSAGIGAWLDNYMHYEARAGNPQAAINLEVPRATSTPSLTIGLHGFNGQLPNLDMLNALGRILSRTGLSSQYITLYDRPVGVREKVLGLLDSRLRVPPTLASFMIDQAIGVPTGDHAYFNRYRIDSITIRMGDLPVTSKYSGRYRPPTQGNVVSGVVGLLRSLNNLLEHLHQSFYFYVLTAQNRYLSIAEYSVSIGLLVVPLLVAIIPTLRRLTPSTVLKKLVKKRKKKGKKSSDNKSKSSSKGGKLRKKFKLIKLVIKAIKLIFKLVKNKKKKQAQAEAEKAHTEGEPTTVTETIETPAEEEGNTNGEKEEEEEMKEKEEEEEGEEEVVEEDESEKVNGRAILRSVVEIVLIHALCTGLYFSGLYFFKAYPAEWLAGCGAAIFAVAFVALPLIGRAISSEVDVDSWQAFSLLPITLFLTTVSLVNFSFCAIAAALTVPFAVLFSRPFARKNRAVLTAQIGLLLLVTLPAVVCLAANGLGFETPLAFVKTVYEQHVRCSSLLFPFLVLIYLALNISQLKLLIYSF